MARNTSLPPGPTPKQRTCYELRKSGSTWAEIGTAMGISAPAARAHVKRAVSKGLQSLFNEKFARLGGQLGRTPRLGDGTGMFASETQEFDPKKCGELFASAGVPPRLAAALVNRIGAQYGMAKKELRKMTLAERVSDAMERADEVASNIDAVSMAGMNAKDLAIAWKVLIDGSQLLGGKPTQIVDFNLRQRLSVLMPQMLAEARRRGITIEGTATLVEEESNVDQ